MNQHDLHRRLLKKLKKAQKGSKRPFVLPVLEGIRARVYEPVKRMLDFAAASEVEILGSA